MRRVSEIGWLIAAFVAMAMGIAVDHGHFSMRALILIGMSAAALVFAAWRHRQPAERGTVSLEAVLGGALVFLLVVGVFDAPGYHLESEGFRWFYVVAQLAIAVAVAVTLVWPRGRWAVVLSGVVLAVTLRIGMVIGSPAPVIDVFTQFQESAAHLLEGLNPYATPVSDPSNAEARFGYAVSAYAYPPANLYVQTLFYALSGDVRITNIVFEVLAAGCLWLIVPLARRGAAGLLVLLFLFQPRGLFVIEQAWNEPLLVGAAGFFLWLAATRPQSRWVVASFGIFLSLKQYLVFFALAFFARRRGWRWVVPAAAVIFATWLPFLIWDAESAVRNGLLFQFGTPFRTDGLTLAAAVHRWLGWESTKWVAIGAGLAVSVVCRLKFSDERVSGPLYSSVLTTLAGFLCGSQAFANYYYFLGAMILFLIALRLREEGDEAV